MVEYKESNNLSGTLKALVDDNRRAILEILVQQGACRVTDLAQHFELSLNAVSKHIKVLESVGLIERTTNGRTHWIKARLEPIKAVEQWLASLKSVWAMRLDTLEQVLQEQSEQSSKNNEDNAK